MMALKKNSRGSRFADDVPWRAHKGEKPVPLVNKGGVVPVRQGPNFQYAISIMKVWPVVCVICKVARFLWLDVMTLRARFSVKDSFK